MRKKECDWKSIEILINGKTLNVKSVEHYPEHGLRGYDITLNSETDQIEKVKRMEVELKELRQMLEFRKAKNELKETFFEMLRLKQIAEWLNKKLSK
jgi:hypothetical protein